MSINVREWDVLLVLRYLRFAIRVPIFFSFFFFFTFCNVTWVTLCDIAFSDYYKSILFHVGSSAFEISTKLVAIVAQ